MKANELRIGNLVTDAYYDSFKTTIEVESIDNEGINLLIEDDGNYAECADIWIEPYYKFDTLFPIPLTEEWLLKFGFKPSYLKDKITIDWFNAPDKTRGLWIKLRTNLYGNKLFLLAINRFDDDFRNILYVHQLQNLYFALTNNELTL